MKLRGLTRYTIGESSLSPRGHADVAGLKLRFAYQRLGINFDESKAVCAIYPGLFDGSLRSPGVELHALFASSGNHATSVFFHALQLINPKASVAVLKGTATGDIEKCFKFKLSDWGGRGGRVKTDILYWDSSIEAEKHRPELKGIRLLAFDTTFFSHYSDDLRTMVRSALDAGIPVVLLRDHFSLDSLGTDCGRLGSVVILIPRGTPLKSKKLAQAIHEKIREIGPFHGTYAGVSQIFPFLFSKRFHKLNEKRLQRMRANNRRVGLALEGFKSDFFEIQRFRHEMFFLVRIPAVSSSKASRKNELRLSVPDFDQKTLRRIVSGLARLFHQDEAAVSKLFGQR